MPRGGYRGGIKPILPPEQKKVTRAFSLSPALDKAIADTAKSRNISKSELVETILIAYFEE